MLQKKRLRSPIHNSWLAEQVSHWNHYHQFWVYCSWYGFPITFHPVISTRRPWVGRPGNHCSNEDRSAHVFDELVVGLNLIPLAARLGKASPIFCCNLSGFISSFWFIVVQTWSDSHSVLTAASARLVELSDLFRPEGFSFNKRLHGSPSAVHFALVGSLGVVAVYPCVQQLGVLPETDTAFAGRQPDKTHSE